MAEQISFFRCSVLGCVFTASNANSLKYHVIRYHQSDDYIWCFFCGYSSKDHNEVLYTHHCPFEEERMAELDRLDELGAASRAQVPSTSSVTDPPSTAEQTQQRITDLLIELGRRNRPRMINPSNSSNSLVPRKDYVSGGEESQSDDTQPEDSSDDDFLPENVYKPKSTPASKRKKKTATKKANAKKNGVKKGAEQTAKVPGKRGRPRKSPKIADPPSDNEVAPEVIKNEVAPEEVIKKPEEISISDPFEASKRTVADSETDTDSCPLRIDESYVSDKSETPIEDLCMASKRPNEGATKASQAGSAANQPDKPTGDPPESKRIDVNNNEVKSPSEKAAEEDATKFKRLDEELAKLHEE